jgi:hypothetical protein
MFRFNIYSHTYHNRGDDERTTESVNAETLIVDVGKKMSWC